MCESVVEILKYDHADDNFCETLFMPYKALLTYGFMDEILKWEHSRRKLLKKTVPGSFSCYTKRASNVSVDRQNPGVKLILIKVLSSMIRLK